MTLTTIFLLPCEISRSRFIATELGLAQHESQVMGATFNPRKKTMSVSCKKSDHGPGIVWPRGHVTYVMMSDAANEKLYMKEWTNENEEIFQFIWQQQAAI